MHEKIIILDFGSQYTQLIARCVRESEVYCEILPWNTALSYDQNIKGFILAGSPFSVNDENAPKPDISAISALAPVLGICYGAQLIAQQSGGMVWKSTQREYGRANLTDMTADILLHWISEWDQVWMSHSDSIKSLPDTFTVLASTASIPVAIYKTALCSNDFPVYGLQFHPEVTHSACWRQLLQNFLFAVCKCSSSRTADNFIDTTVNHIREHVWDQHVIMALSGGVDSTVAAMLIHKAIGNRLHCIFVDNWLLRKNEFEEVLHNYEIFGLQIQWVDAKEHFYTALKNIKDPETKRKVIGKCFIDVFMEEAAHLPYVSFLWQGTIYPDVIESISVNGPSVTIKSHHNVWGLPDMMQLNLIEPLRLLFKDEVRRVGYALGLPANLLQRHPFPGPGLGIRIIGEVSAEKVAILQEADSIFITHLRAKGLYDKVRQAGTMLLPVQTVGVMWDERTYEFTIALRAVTSIDWMTADRAHLPYEFLAEVSNDIINRVKWVNRVVYDISSKPPATIERE